MVLKNQPLQNNTSKSLLTDNGAIIGDNSSNNYSNEKQYAGSIDPLSDEAIRYLQENITLPPIDFTDIPTKVYVNIHPTESLMSSSPNSVDEWWDHLDYSEEGDLFPECGVLPEIHIKRRLPYPMKTAFERPINLHKETNKMKGVYPQTLLTQNEFQNKRLYYEDQERREIIYKLERQMISLFNLKKQYKKNIGRQGCGREGTVLPPLVARDSDPLARQRDSLLSRIRRKKADDEVRRQKQVERKIYIVKKLLEEQKRKLIEERKQYKTGNELSYGPSKKKKIHTIIPDENSLEIPENVDNIEDKTSVVNETFVDDLNIQGEILEGEVKVDETAPPADSRPQSARKSSGKKSVKSVKGRKKKSSDLSTKTKEGKSDKKKKKQKESAEPEPPATCEETVELPASQLPELSEWFKNWRDNVKESEKWLRFCEAQDLNMEVDAMLKPTKIIFKDVLPRRKFHQEVFVCNNGQEPLKCRVIGVFQHEITGTSPIIQTYLNGPSKAIFGEHWILGITLESLDVVQDGLAHVMLTFCREDGIRTKLPLDVEIFVPRAVPTLSTSVIRFGPQMSWSGSGHTTKYVELVNDGSLGCVVTWTDLTDTDMHSEKNFTYENCKKLKPEINGSDSKHPSVSQHISMPDEENLTEDGSNDTYSELSEIVFDPERESLFAMAREIVEYAFSQVFKVFRINARQPLMVRPHSRVTLPIKFIPSMTDDKGDVFTRFLFKYESKKTENETQELIVCGKIEEPPCKVVPTVLDMKVCYTGGSVQQAEFRVISSLRHACSVSTRVPRALATTATVVPGQAILQAYSSIGLIVRLILSWDFLNKHSSYLDRDTGLLSFPVTIYVSSNGTPVAPPLELTVMAVVAPPCPLTLSPALLNLSTVSTMETVVADLKLTNHEHHTYHYSFVGLPESIMIEPGGGSGTIFPTETLDLQLLFSPRPRDFGLDCERPGGEGEVMIILRCFTSVSLASPIQRQKLEQLDTRKKISWGSFFQTSSTTYTVTAPSEMSQYSDGEENTEEKTADTRTVRFEDNIGNDMTEVSSASSVRNELTENDIIEEEKLTISEIDEDDNEIDLEELWDYFSSFKLAVKVDTRSVDSDGLKGASTGSVDENKSKVLETKGSVNANEVDEMLKESEKEDAKLIFDNGFNQTAAKDDTLNDNVKSPSVRHTIEPPLEEKKEESEDGLVEEPDEYTKTEFLFERGEKNKESVMKVCMEPDTSQRYTSLCIKAYVVDPLVELSSQVVIMPDTPCSSYSIAHIYLRSRNQKQCSIHQNISKYKCNFEFISPGDDLVIEPKRGEICYKESKKINLIFRPKLNNKEIYDKALEMKIDKMKWNKIQNMLAEYYKAQEKKQPKVSFQLTKEESPEGGVDTDADIKNKQKKKSKDSVASDTTKRKGSSLKSADIKEEKGNKKKKSKGSVASVSTKKKKTSLKGAKVKRKSSGPLPEVVIDPSTVEVTSDDLKETEMLLLKYMEPYMKTFNISCVLDTEINSDSRRQECLQCEVLCRVVPPAVFINSPSVLDFGPTALGAQAKLIAPVTSLSFFDTKIRLTTLNPAGPFFCPAHLEFSYWKNGEFELPPEHSLSIPVVFHPTECGKFVESFEIVSGRSVTHFSAVGEGVFPSFDFRPDQEVFMVTSAIGKKTDITISVSNTCKAPLSFHVGLEYIKEGLSLPSPKSESASPESSPKQKGKQGSPKKEKKPKGLPMFTMLTEELEEVLEKHFVDVPSETLSEPVFKIIDSNDNFTVLAGETKQVTVRFTLPVAKLKPDEKHSKGEKLSIKENKNKLDKKKNSDVTDTLTLKSTKTAKKKPSLSEKKGSVKESGAKKSSAQVSKDKTIYAAKFTVHLVHIKKVKDLVFIGTKK